MSSLDFLSKLLGSEIREWDLIESYMIIRATLAPLRLTRWQMFKHMVASIVRGLSMVTLIGLFLILIGTVVVALQISTNRSRVEKLGIPVVGSSRDKNFDFQKAVEAGKRMYPDQPYIIRTQGKPYVIFPPQMFDELKKLPERLASAQDFFVNAYFGEYTTAGKETAALLRTISVDLARSIPVKVPSRQEDAKHAIEEALGDCRQWKEVELFPAITTIIAQMNACSFFGRDVGRSKNWVRLVAKFPFEVMISTFIIAAIPSTLHGILAPLIYAPAIITKWRMQWAIKPVIKDDMKEYLAAKDKRDLLKLTEVGKVPFTASLMTRYAEGEATLAQLLQDYITVSFESTPSSSGALYSILRELAGRPELIDILRKELEDVLVDGKLPKTHLAELCLMDSVMKESARYNPFSLLALYRMLRVPLQLTMGPKLPAGTIIACDVHHINNSKDLWRNPATFDGMRFHELRKQPGMENKWQYTSVAKETPGWGDGNMACPGRFFANSTIKIALAHLILNYDFKFVEGQSVPAKLALPNGSWNPGLETRFMFKARK